MELIFLVTTYDIIIQDQFNLDDFTTSNNIIYLYPVTR